MRQQTKVYRVGIRKVESWEPKYAVNDGKECWGLFWSRAKARTTADLLNKAQRVKR